MPLCVCAAGKLYVSVIYAHDTRGRVGEVLMFQILLSGVGPKPNEDTCA